MLTFNSFALKLNRQRRGLSIRQLAASSGLSRSIIHQLEQATHDNVTLRTLNALAKALAIEPIELLS